MEGGGRRRYLAQVRLPDGASRLQRYTRHYALGKDGKVLGVYVLGAPASRRRAAKKAPDSGCEELMLDEGEIVGKSVPCPAEAEGGEQVAAGGRRWLNDVAELTMIMNGECAIVTVRFNPSTRRVEQASCNGEA